MVYQDTLYKVFYVAQNETTGLTDVQIAILTPAGVTEGYFIMTETTRPGIYSYDYTVAEIGRYLFECDSATLPGKYAQAIDVVALLSTSTVPVAEFDEV